MKNILNEELIKQIRLMNFDRSKTLLEQDPKEQKPKEQKPKNPSDRLGSEFNATPKIFSDPIYKEYENLSPEEKQKRENESLNKKWKSRLCTTNAQQKGSVYIDGYYESHEDFCKPFGGTQVFRTKSEGKSFLGISEKDVLGEGFFCGCKFNGQTLIGDKTVKVNEYLNRPMTEITYPIADFLSEPHNIAMIASIAFSMFGGGVGDVFSLIFDAIDVGIFIEEGDYFMAGLAAMFAIIPFGDLMKAYLRKYPGAKNFTKKVMKDILEKLKLKKPLTPDEKKFVDAVTSAKQQNKVFWKMVREKIRMIIIGEKPNYVVALLVWLVKKGFLTGKFLLKWGLIIGGVFYSWYKIAEWLGIAPNQEEMGGKNQLSKTDFVEMNVLSYLQNMLSKGYNYNTSLNKTELPEVAALQYVLYAGGYFTPEVLPTFSVKKGILSFNNSKDIKNIKVYSVIGKMVDEITNNKNDKIELKNKLNKGVYILKITDKNNEVKTEKLNYAGEEYNIYSVGKVSPTNKVKWGYYDNFTKNAVENFQQKNSLTDDGIAGSNTIKSLIDKIKNNKITDFSKPENIAKYDFGKDVVEKEVEFTGEEFKKSYEEQKTQVLDSVYQEYDKMKEKINVDSLQGEWSKGKINIVVPEIPK